MERIKKKYKWEQSLHYMCTYWILNSNLIEELLSVLSSTYMFNTSSDISTTNAYELISHDLGLKKEIWELNKQIKSTPMELKTI